MDCRRTSLFVRMSVIFVHYELDERISKYSSLGTEPQDRYDLRKKKQVAVNKENMNIILCQSISYTSIEA